MSRRLIMFLISLGSLVFIVSLSRSIYFLWQRGNLVAEQEQLKAQTEAENKKLREKLSEVESEAFIEKEAREKLNLSRDGEIVVVLPKIASASALPSVATPVLSPWKQWLALFF